MDASFLCELQSCGLQVAFLGKDMYLCGRV